MAEQYERVWAELVQARLKVDQDVAGSLMAKDLSVLAQMDDCKSSFLPFLDDHLMNVVLQHFLMTLGVD